MCVVIKVQDAVTAGFFSCTEIYTGHTIMNSMYEFPPNGTMQDLSRGPMIVYVNVGWCGHCKHTKPIMEKVARTLGSMVPVISVDGDKCKSVTTQLGAKGFPTIMYIDESGKRFQYTGDRSVDAISSFVCHNSSDRHAFCKRMN